jgi:hypothetical protein
VPYDLRTELVGIFARHADGCPAREGGPCLCGPLGYHAGVWDWQASRWVLSPLLRTTEAAQAWQREANQHTEGGSATASAETGAFPSEDDADRSEKLFWWAFCYVGLGFAGVALALFFSDIAG